MLISSLPIFLFRINQNLNDFIHYTHLVSKFILIIDKLKFVW